MFKGYSAARNCLRLKSGLLIFKNNHFTLCRMNEKNEWTYLLKLDSYSIDLHLWKFEVRESTSHLKVFDKICEFDWSIMISIGWEYEEWALNPFTVEHQRITNQTSPTRKLAKFF